MRMFFFWSMPFQLLNMALGWGLCDLLRRCRVDYFHLDLYSVGFAWQCPSDWHTVFYEGVYADEMDAKKRLNEKYGKLSTAELKESKEIQEDLMESDICMTVRLQIVYGRLSIRSVRSAFEESVGSRLQNFGEGGEGDNKELLQR